MISFVGKNSIKNLYKIIQDECAQNLLIFSGNKSYQTIRTVIENQLTSCEIVYYNDFSPNPKKEEIDIAIKKLNCKFDLILAVGGGSVIDFAKAYRFYTKKATKLIAIPTTCGTGSEATQFAVIYIDGVKNSLDEPSILPDYAIVDSQFVENNPKYLKACTAMDAFCQAVESYWAVKSTEESRNYAKQAIELCRDNIVSYVNSNNSHSAEKMVQASHLAGKAINISRTTAPHALSYKITSEYGLPHGHAVALSIRDIFKANININNDTCNDSRGVEFVKEKMKELVQILEIKNIEEYWNNLLNELNLEYDFKKLGIIDKELIINSVNVDRLKNNPKNIENDVVSFWK